MCFSRSRKWPASILFMLLRRQTQNKNPARLHFCMPLPDVKTVRQQKRRQRTVPRLQKTLLQKVSLMRRWGQHKPYTSNTSGNRALRYGTCGPPHLQIYSDILQLKVYNVNRQKYFYFVPMAGTICEPMRSCPQPETAPSSPAQVFDHLSGNNQPDD